MTLGNTWIGLAAAATFAGAAGTALAQSSVSYGRITAVQMITESDARARTGGAIIGGTLGAAVGSGRSGSNRALGGVGGAFAGSQIGRLASQRQAFEYTVLLGGTQTITMITDQAGKRVGDCVAVERGAFNNLRLVPEAKCAPPARQAAAPAAPPPAARPTPAEQRQSDACVQAKEQLLAAETDDAFDRAERRVRLLCGE
ncbi:MAG: hypothetical protein U1F58_05745 [Burkholderiales bacterium]